jgi:hypothetical protein
MIPNVKISDVEAVEKAKVVRPLTAINERECVARLAEKVPAGGSIVEIGCLYGGMTAVMGLANPQARIVTIDDFSWHPEDDVPTSGELLLENMQKVGVANVIVMEGDSRTIGPAWKQPIDLLWIDGGHSFDYIWQDLKNFGPHAKVIAVHDFDNPAWKDIRHAVERFLGIHYQYELGETVGTVAVLRRGLPQ